MSGEFLGERLGCASGVEFESTSVLLRCTYDDFPESLHVTVSHVIVLSYNEVFQSSVMSRIEERTAVLLSYAWANRVR